jgi:hypothetical protein
MQLLILDTAQIQSYVFGSNRLRENIGASYLVHCATGEWVKEVLDPLAHNVENLDENEYDGRCIEDGVLDAEVIYAGGGNVLILFRGPGEASGFTSHLSRRVMEDAPGLQIVVARQPFRWEQDNLKSALKTLFRKLAEVKRERVPSAPLLGLGVTAMCSSTGLPAVGYTEPIREGGEIHEKAFAASGEILKKRQNVESADDRLERLLNPSANLSGAGYRFPNELDELGRSTGEHSFIAVVHADGNGMGKRFQEVIEEESSPREGIESLRRFSAAVNRAAQNALRSTLDRLIAAVKNGSISHPNPDLERLKVFLNGDKLPFRPLVFGGGRRNLRLRRSVGNLPGGLLPPTIRSRDGRPPRRRRESDRLRGNCDRKNALPLCSCLCPGGRVMPLRQESP